MSGFKHGGQGIIPDYLEFKGLGITQELLLNWSVTNESYLTCKLLFITKFVKAINQKSFGFIYLLLTVKIKTLRDPICGVACISSIIQDGPTAH